MGRGGLRRSSVGLDTKEKFQERVAKRADTTYKKYVFVQRYMCAASYLLS